ncbi:Uu.00g043790.m01.CDS01 [Anthostomella pinea]|uniref:Uu.00g043790.m01.CDS01 n=1 Tax=Anthostomella pinea TaxID=933095 RepID=A0AAI8YE59_9PEZI|nr:Uu.00g043790.m01.CDS01 [Anthostomella pinea]
MAGAFGSGAAFGAALTTAGIHQPGIIVAQMDLTNYRMVETFLTASGTSMLLVTVLQRLGYLSLKPRSFSSLGLFSPVDGNIIGGCLHGAGMALSGACPGTLFAQIGVGICSGVYTLGGGILGGILWAGVLRPIIGARKKPKDSAPDKLTVPEALAGVDSNEAIVTGHVIGFEEVGDYFWWVTRGGSKPKSYSAIFITTGVVAGTMAVSLVVPSVLVPQDRS